MAFSDIELDALKEIVNIGIGRSASMMNSIIHHHIDLTVPSLHPVSGQSLLESHTLIAGPRDTVNGVQIRFQGGIKGAAAIIFPLDSACKLVNIVVEDTGGEFDSLKEGVLTEIGNILINGIIGSISNLLSLQLTYSIPVYMENSLAELLSQLEKEIDDSQQFMVAEIRFSAANLHIEGNFLLFFELRSFEKLLGDFVAEKMG